MTDIEKDKLLRITICGANILNVENIQYYFLKHYIKVKLNKTEIH
jgi:hypothetical protein